MTFIGVIIRGLPAHLEMRSVDLYTAIQKLINILISEMGRVESHTLVKVQQSLL